MIKPMLAQPAEELPVGGWSYEVKWDGVRVVAIVTDGQVTMQSRSGKTDYAQRYGHVAVQLAVLPDCVLDGELVTFGENGGTAGLARGVTPATYVAFDVLECPPQGAEVMKWPLRARRELLRQLVTRPGLDNVAVSPVFTDGDKLLAHVLEQGLEGIVAKRDESRYELGKRSPSWVKVKPRPEQEFVVCGWTDGKGERIGMIGGLVLGVYDGGEFDGEWVYVGRVGCRTDMQDAMYGQMLDGDCPFPQVPKEERDAHWLRPELVVQVAFQRWTDDGRLWHPTAKGLRDDKVPTDVRREV